MTRQPIRLITTLVAVFVMAWAPGAFAQPAGAVHGESSEFAHPTLRLVWAVQRGADENSTLVVMRVVNVGDVYQRVQVDGVDPFTKNRVELVPARALGRSADLRIPRARFADHPSAEIHLFRTAEEERAGKPALTVFYLGIPDTTPEFADRAKLEAHLADMAAKTRPR